MKQCTLFEDLCLDSTLLDAWKTVKQKGSTGGIDGVSIADFDENIGTYLAEIKDELKSGLWKPEPYLRISIPKKENERRKLGLLCIKDKVVQQAIKQLIEPRFEKVFVNNSYGYRPNKGHTRAIRFAQSCCRNKNYPIILRLDIDNYFDTINHELLFRRLHPLVPDTEILRLIQLCVKMGTVNRKMNWDEIKEGIPQGAVLSPLLANFYLHSFDQFILSRTKMYVRYADDFIICCESIEKAEQILKEGTIFLEQRLKLHLNEPLISEIRKGFEFLGITLDNRKLSLSEKKKVDLQARIQELKWVDRTFSDDGLRGLQGIQNYYGNLLPQIYLLEFDTILLSHLKKVIENDWTKIPNKSTLYDALKQINFYSQQNILQKGKLKSDLINYYLSLKTQTVRVKNEEKNRKLIIQRKKEYRKKENETSELIVNTYGSCIGVNNKGISLKICGKQQDIPSVNNLRHITILSDGVSISSNAVGFCMRNNISITYFSSIGQHCASILSNNYLQLSLWKKQAFLSLGQQSTLAVKIILGKLKNQINLIKYFHKYHKVTSEQLCKKYDEIIPKLNVIVRDVIQYIGDLEYRTKLLALEAQGAQLYWDYVRELITDDNVAFERRERHGATDLVNSMLNYGYSILYARIWQALLYRRLNPTESVMHVPQNGKPTFVYDVIELFRTQVVDRIVISMVQKKEPLVIQDGLLDNSTKRLLVLNIMERINRYEKYREKECRLCDIINLQVKEIADYITDGGLTAYKPYIAKW